MSQLVVLNLAQGNLTEGCSTVIAQLWQADRPTAMQVLGSLPPAPELAHLYARWQQLYQALYAYKSWRSPLIEIDEDEDITHISEAEFNDLCHQIQSHLNAWLNTPQFRPIDRQLRTHLVPADEIRLVISATDRALLRLP